MQNTLPPEIESLCFQKKDGYKIPMWPYVVAVTGHRSFAKPGEVVGQPGYDMVTIKAAFKKELEQMARQWKKACGKADAPFILLAGMADGADQLAAEAALELPSELNVKVVAVLPMEKDLFRLTISNKERFDRLLDGAYLTYALPLPDDSSEYRAKVADVENPDTEPLRQKQYDVLGKFLALHSHVLFALWDGIDMPHLQGGTSTVIHFKLEGNTENQTHSDTLTYASVGPVVQFLLPRNNDMNRETPVGELNHPEQIAVFYWSKRDLWDKNQKCYFFPTRKYMTEENRCKTLVSLKPEIIETFHRIGDLNRQSIKHSRKLQKKEAESIRYLFGNREDYKDFCDTETGVLVHHYTYVDKLAEYFKQRMKRIVVYYLLGVVLFLLSGSLLSSFWEIRQNDWGKENFFNFVHSTDGTCCDMLFSLPLTTILYWISILIFISGYVWARYMKNHVRLYRFRAVAEALRVQIFWRISGLGDCVSGYYRTHQIQETDWLRAAVNGLDVLLPSPTEVKFKEPQAERLTFIRNEWINGQLRFFQKRLENGDEMNCHSNIGKISLALWVFSILSFPFIPTWMEFLHRFPFVAEITQVIYGLFFVSFPIYGVWLCWKQIYQPQSELNRYKQMLFPYDRALLLLKPEPRPEVQQTILRQLGTEAISENTAWLLSIGERELTLPR